MYVMILLAIVAVLIVGAVVLRELFRSR